MDDSPITFKDILESLLSEVSAQETAWIPYDDKYETHLALYILGHNFDVVATIMSMSHLSWEQGFSAGRVIASICEPISGICENPGPVPILENQ